jgi:hypothetical protein
MSEKTPTIDNEIGCSRFRDHRGVKRASPRQLRRWSVAELIARSLARPDHGDVGHPWGTPPAPSA